MLFTSADTPLIQYRVLKENIVVEEGVPMGVWNKQAKNVWEMGMALGDPVDPEEHRINAGSSSHLDKDGTLFIREKN